MSLERYSKIKSGMKREFILLQGTGCRWGKCTFCDYHKDTSSDPFKVNKEILDLVTGEFGMLDVINSGSAMELDRETIRYISQVLERKAISTLWLECHYMYRNMLSSFSENFHSLVKYRTGIESFNPKLRTRWKKGIAEDVRPEDIRKYFSGVCILLGLKGETREDIIRDIEIAEEYFEYYSLNLFTPNTTDEELDEDLASFVKEEVPDLIRNSTKAELLIENTDLGVG